MPLTQEFPADLDAWFKASPPGIALHVAYRAVLRSAAIAWRSPADDWSFDWSSFPILASNFVNGRSIHFHGQPVAEGGTSLAYTNSKRLRELPQTEYSPTCSASHAASHFDLGHLDIAIQCAAGAFAEIDGTATPFWDSMRNDREFVEGRRNLGDAPLLNSGHIALIEWETTRGRWHDRPSPWPFFAKWYQGLVDGVQQDWNLLNEVSLIANEVWQFGPDAVAEAIQEIELARAITATPNAERISINPETGHFRAELMSNLPPDHLPDATDMLRDAQAIFGPNGRGRNLAGLIIEERGIIDEALDRYCRRPRMLHNACLRVMRRIRAKRSAGLLPEDDDQIIDYEAQVRAVADHLFVFDNEVRQSVTARLELRLEAATPDQSSAITLAADAAAVVSEGYLAEDLPVDARAGENRSLTVEEKKDSLFRTASRLLRISAIATGKGIRWTYQGGRWVLHEAAEVSDDLKKIAEAVKPVAIAVVIILTLI